MPLRAIGPYPSLQIVPPHSDWPDGIDLAGEVQTKVPLGGAVGALTNHGGPVMTAPKLVALYAGTFWADRARNDAFLHDLCTAGYEAAAHFQGVGPGQFLGSFSLPAPSKANLLDSECQALLQAALAANAGIPRPDANTLYMLILPHGITVTFDGSTDSSCAAFCGYHSSAAGLIYSVQTASDCQGCNLGDAYAGFTMVQAHEYIEAATDPLGSGWYNNSTGAENADEAAWTAVPYGPWVVQGYAALVGGTWVNAVGPYTPTQQPPPAWQPDPAIQAFYAWQAAAARWCTAAYAAATSPADAARVAAEEHVIEQTAVAWVPFVAGKAKHAPAKPLPVVPTL